MHRRHLVPALLLAAVGCGPRYELTEVPIEGGTPAQREAVAEELAAFDRWLGPGRIELSAIEISAGRDNSDEWHGSYHGFGARILVSAGLAPAALRQTLRHELCHAVDHQEHLLLRKDPIFDALAAVAIADPAHPLHAKVIDRTERMQRAEVLAYVCQQAPLGTSLLARPCRSNDAEYAGAAGWIADTIWTGEPDVTPDPARALSPEVVGWPAPGVPTTLHMIGAEAADEAGILLDGEAVSTVWTFVSTVDGSEVPFTQQYPDEPILAGYETTGPFGAPELPTLDPMSVNEALAVTDGDTTLRIVEGLVLHDLGMVAPPHVLAHTGGGWSVVDGACPTRTSSVFLANGQLYVGWADDDDVLWAPVD